jgi:hypothetical protein
MNKETISQAKADEEFLTFDVPDEALERAGSTDGNAIMTTIASVRQSCKCESCGQWLMVPERSTYVNEEQITHFGSVRTVVMSSKPQYFQVRMSR